MPPRRPRVRSVRSGALLFLLALLGSTPVFAQDRPPPRLPPDTTTPEPAADTLVPPPRLPALEPTGPAGWEAGVWEWDRQALAMLPDISLLELLERIPGITPVRAGIAGQPEGAGVFGTAAVGIRYVLDGFELDPLSTPTYDPSRIPLLALDRVRVERRVTGAVVHLETLTPVDARPHSVVEAATGDLGINLFRGMFLTPSVLGGPFAAGFERLAASSAGSSNLTAGWLKWTFIRDGSGVQLEYRQTDTDRTGVGPGLSGTRRDWALRARTGFFGFTAEGYAGASSLEDDDGALVLAEGTPQVGVRLHREVEAPVPLEVRGALRYRDHPRLPVAQGEVELWTAPAPWASVGVTAVLDRWAGGGTSGRTVVGGQLGPFLGLSAFGETTLGTSPAARLVAPVDSVALTPGREGRRIGVSFDRWGAHLGAAALWSSADTSASFGVGFDPNAPSYPGGEARGFEAVATLPTGWEALRIEGWYVGMDVPEGWLYLPESHWRAALVYHDRPLASGNLEVQARVEHVFRGRMTTPCTALLACEDPDADGFLSVGSYRGTNLELTIRVVSVRAFVRWENVFHRRFQQDLPFGYPAPPGSLSRYSLPGQHILYGVKWEFWN